ncbi:MAG: hypothetical protein D6718_02545 [Acidobacteria bacterium]|nr:MAG: hypothetical protein D6718_02545 [Acidobacteriota bacterium]
MRTRHGKPEELRCEGCGILLATIDDNGLTIRRGQLQVTVGGDLHASIVCYRPRCRRLNVIRLNTRRRGEDAAA